MLPETETCHFLTPDQVENFEGVIIDVRTQEAYDKYHIPGVANHCVYQVDFMEKFPEAYPDKSTSILIYGDGDPYKADLAALGRLRSLGYTNVSILEGGLVKWVNEGRPSEGTGCNETSLTSQRLELNTERTKIRWTGRNLTNQHRGEVTAAGGYVDLGEDGLPTAGKVTVDLRQMVCQDIEDQGMAAMLIGHLASADFFEVESYPEASFELIQVCSIANATYGMPNYVVKGNLSARGLSVEIDIEALIEPIENGYVFQSLFSFDRTQLGALYGSGKIFEQLGMHLVNDLVSIDIAAFFVTSNSTEQ